MSRDNRDRLLLAIGLLLIKGTLLLALGPAHTPDTGGYVGYAGEILAGRLGDAGLYGTTAPGTLFRVIGFPAVLAAFMTFGGPYWDWLLVAVQMVLSLAASIGLHVMARHFGLTRGLAALVMLGMATSLPLVLDQAVLSDSLFSTALQFCVLVLCLPLLAGRRVGVAAALGAGLLFAAAFLLREATLFLSLGILPLVALAGLGDSRPTWRGARHLILVCVVFMLPLLLVQQGYREWNRSRIGMPLITTGAQTTMFQALADAAAIDPVVLEGDDLVHRTARDMLHGSDFSRILEMLTVLFQQHRMTAVDQSQAGFTAYYQAWRDHPGIMTRMVLSHLRSNQAQMTLRPVESLRELILWTRYDDGGFARWRAVREGRWWMAPVVALDGLSKAAAVIVFAAFTLLTPWRLLRDRLTPAHATATGLWLLYFAMLGLYALVHLETRYVAAVVPLSLVVGVFNLDWAWQWWKRHRRAATNGL